MDIGSEIRRLRISRGLTQAQLAEGIFDRSYLSQIERGYLVPPLHTVQLLAERLDVTPNALMPQTDYREELRHAEMLLNKGRRNRNLECIQESWAIFYHQKHVDKMLETVLQWADIAPNSPELLDSLSTSIAWSIVREPLPSLFWEVYVRLGNTYFSMGQYERAAWAYREIIHQCPPHDIRVRTLVNLGSALIELFEYEEALHSFEKGLECCGSNSKDRVAARCYHGLGVCCRQLGQWDLALSHTEKAHNLYISIDRIKFYETHHNLGALWLDRRNLPRAKHHLTEALNFYRDGQHKTQLTQICEEFVRSAYYDNDWKQGHAMCMEGLCTLGEEMPYLAGRLYIWKSILYLRQGEPDHAIESIYCARSLLGNHIAEVVQHLTPDIEHQLVRDIMDLALPMNGATNKPPNDSKRGSSQ
ncbi:MAG: tetratricopeptide repeat protein [Bacilli bacterium]